MSNLCNCTRPTRDGYTICDTCKSDLEQHLAEMRWLNDQLDISLTRTRAVTYNGAGGRSADTPLPWNDRASRARHELKTEMVSWVRALRLGTERWPLETLPGIAAWLLCRLDRIAKHDNGWEIFDGITRASQKARAVVFAKPKEKFVIWTCEGQINDEGEITETPCDGFIRYSEGDAVAECDKCLRAYDIAAAIKSRDDILADHMMTTTEIADMAYRTFSQRREKVLNLLKVWQKRDRITAHSHVDGADRFRYGDVLMMLSRTYGDTA